MRNSGLYFHKVKRGDTVIVLEQEVSLIDLRSGFVINKGIPNVIGIKKENGVFKINVGISNLKAKESGYRTDRKWRLFLIPKEYRQKGIVSFKINNGGNPYPEFCDITNSKKLNNTL